MARYDIMLMRKINNTIRYATKCGMLKAQEGPRFAAQVARMAMQHQF
jgi:hypothetical protein